MQQDMLLSLPVACSLTPHPTSISVVDAVDIPIADITAHLNATF